MRLTTVVSSVNLMMELELCSRVQPGQQGEEEGAQHTSLGGPCVQGGGAGCAAADPHCLWSHCQEVAQGGMIVLNAELKSMNSILTWESLFSRCVRAGWRAVAMASLVEQFHRYANWKGSREGGSTDLMCSMTNRSKHFMRIRVSATGR